MAPIIPGYELQRQLGRGGMGEVWLAVRHGVGGVSKTVAIKLVRIDPLQPKQGEAFLQEARLSTALSHSNVAQVFDVGTTDEFGFLAMELVDGVDLSRLMGVLGGSGQRVSIGVAAYVVGQMLRGLGYSHQRTLHGAPLLIVHRDVSPHNVLVSVSGDVKIVDFGIARWALRDTTGHDVKGKLRFMAPEQLAGGCRRRSGRSVLGRRRAARAALGAAVPPSGECAGTDGRDRSGDVDGGPGLFVVDSRDGKVLWRVDSETTAAGG